MVYSREYGKKGYGKYGYSRRVGPLSSTVPNGIKQGEHIFELLGDNGIITLDCMYLKINLKIR
ncbi:hypothetical protein NGI46_19635 [Peribacillus butanolivorans]|nr:hypothetical protein [Peribacillus butanolivorans]